jgi:hypothetical protein
MRLERPLKQEGSHWKGISLACEFSSSGYLFIRFVSVLSYIAVCSSRGVERERRNFQD